MEFKSPSLGNGVCSKACTPGNHDPTGALGKMNLAVVFRVVGGWGAGGWDLKGAFSESCYWL